ncbi:hypothetical protein KIF24_08760 [Micromonospora sp. Llam7]|uniref:hypothetical protein n=1 Tax=Micromonospora tarapacensis TaxID=2835305 RepID=UPI001C82B696|nr:hypothetical protein [Micromonospora tarapacensis]MBX7266104.1 hypothetical protein [Micromonospora tarapacensis]
MIASAPWVVVLVGGAVLTVLLVVAVLSFRGSERPTAWAPGPPMVLPSPATTTDGAVPARDPATAPATSSTSAVPISPTAPTGQAVGPSSASPAPARASDAPVSSSEPEQSPPAAETGVVGASYQVQGGADAESFQAQLVVRNGTGQSSKWLVELRFGGGVTGVRASSGPGVSVTIRGSGWYLLSGTGPLDAGGQQSVQLRFSRTGGGEYPAQCTVNGAACDVS